MRKKRKLFITLTLLFTLMCSTTVFAVQKSKVYYAKYGDVKYYNSITLKMGIS